MDALKQPEPLSFTGNVDQNWKSFIQRFELYLTAINVDRKGDTQKIALLLTCAGAQAIDVYNTLDIDENDKYEDIKTKLEGFCAPKKNEIYKRFVFRNTKQEEGEQFDSFLTKLKLRSKSCNYGELRDSMIRVQIVYGILNQKTQERLLREADLDLNRAVQVCQANEVSERQINAFSKLDVKVNSAENTEERDTRRTKKSGGVKEEMYTASVANPILLANALHSLTHAKYVVTKATLKHSVGTMMMVTKKKENNKNNTVTTVTQKKEDKEENTCRANQEKGLKQYNVMSIAIAQTMNIIMMKMAYTLEQL